MSDNLSPIDDATLIFSQLISNKPFCSKAISHIDESYFENLILQKLFKFVKKFHDKYKVSPDVLVLQNAIDKMNFHPEQMDIVIQLLQACNEDIISTEIMLDKAESFVKDRALYNAITKSIDIYQGADNTIDVNGIPDLVKKALSQSIQTKMGDFYFSDEGIDNRYDSYHNPELKVPFLIDKMNEITGGGIGKGLHTFVAGINVGKSTFLIWKGVDYLEQGLDVLYITLEMSNYQCGIRFDAAITGYETDEIPKLDKEFYKAKIKAAHEKRGFGQLHIKEYSQNELTSVKLEAYLDELETQYGFVPKAIMIDYMGICAATALKDKNNLGTYYTIVAEEFRGVAQRRDKILWTAQQMTTDKMDNTDPTLKDVGFGQGIPKTSDLVWFGIRTEEMDALGQILIKQDKTRYHKQRVQRFTVGLDIGKMRFYNVDSSCVPETVKNLPVEKAKISTTFNQLKDAKKGGKINFT